MADFGSVHPHLASLAKPVLSLPKGSHFSAILNEEIALASESPEPCRRGSASYAISLGGRRTSCTPSML